MNRDLWREPRDAEDLGGSREGGCRGRRVFQDLWERITRRLPAWKERGPEDPAWVLLEAVAEALGEAEGEADSLEPRLLERALEQLGEEPRWPCAARGAVMFVPAEGAADPVRVPRGTVVLAPPAAGERAEAPTVAFETILDGWCTPARLLRAVATFGGQFQEVFPYPAGGWDCEPALPLWPQPSIPRYLYVGDPALQWLRHHAGALVLQWPGVPSAIVAAAFEVSVRDGWRTVHVDREEHVLGDGKRALRARLVGPWPDLAELTVEGHTSPWVRVSLPGGRRITLQPATLVSVEAEDGSEIPKARAASLAFPRPLFRVLTSYGERTEDHSLSDQRWAAAEQAGSGEASVYLGFDRPTAASLYWSLAQAPLPRGWEGRDGTRQPQLEWQYSSGRGFRPLAVEDSTRGLTHSGVTSWNLPSESSPQDRFGEKLYWVRARWVSGAYYQPPRLRAILPNAVSIRQGRTVRDRILEARRDAPRRSSEAPRSGGSWRVPLAFEEGEPESVEAVEIRMDGESEWRPLGARTGDALAGGWFQARRDPRAGCALEVDPGRPGAASARLRIPRLRLVLGARGNLPPGSIGILASDVAGVLGIRQPLPTEGGRDAEGIDAYLRRVREEWKLGDRLVTVDDYRRYALVIDPEIARVEVDTHDRRPGGLLVTVVPRDPFPPGRLDPARLSWMAEELESRSPLGAAVWVEEARYVPIRVRLRQIGPSPTPSEATRRRLESRLRRFLHPLDGGRDGRGFPWGRWLNESDLLDIIRPVLLEGESAKDAGASDPTETVPEAEGSWPGPKTSSLQSLDWDAKGWLVECTFGQDTNGSDKLAGALPPLPVSFSFPVLERLVVEPEERFRSP